MNSVIQGKALKYGNNINTDIISPPAYMELSMEEAAKFAMSPIDPDFSSKVAPGDILVAENNIGSGSSRETAPLTLKILGIQAIVAKSYARIFYRNCINLGILAIECEDADKISMFDKLQIFTEDGIIRDLSTGEDFQCSVIPPHILKLVSAGGLVESLKQRK